MDEDWTITVMIVPTMIPAMGPRATDDCRRDLAFATIQGTKEFPNETNRKKNHRDADYDEDYA